MNCENHSTQIDGGSSHTKQQTMRLSTLLIISLAYALSTVAVAFTNPSTIRSISISKHHHSKNNSFRAAKKSKSDHEAPLLPEVGRRRTFASLAAFPSLPFFFGGDKKSSSANAADDDKPVADFPMRRLRLPKGGLGREYVIIQVYVEGKGPYDFMLDSGLTTELITPRECSKRRRYC